MTGRERIQAAFRGDRTDMVPFCPNIYQWFYYHHARGTLPGELSGATHPLDALRRLGADILARWDTQLAAREVFGAGDFSEGFEGSRNGDSPLTTAFNTYPPDRDQFRRTLATPHGTLSETWTYSPDAGADFISGHWWKSWDDFKAIRFLLESRDYVFDVERFRTWSERVGTDGLVMAHLTQSPLKTFHWLAGPENASFFLMDHPEEMRELADIHARKALALLEQMVDEPAAEVFISLENLDAPFYPPYFYRDYCDGFFRRCAEIIHSRGKIFMAHACGHTRRLLPLAGESGVDCLEGLTPPPMGDVPLGDARRLSGNPGFTVNGGIDSLHLENSRDAECYVHDYTRELFESMGDKRQFIFASSCSTPVLTPWDNLVHFRNAAREYGRL